MRIWAATSAAKFAVGAGSDDDLDLYQRTAGNLRRLLQSVGLERRPRDVTPSLAEYLKIKSAQKPSGTLASETGTRYRPTRKLAPMGFLRARHRLDAGGHDARCVAALIRPENTRATSFSHASRCSGVMFGCFSSGSIMRYLPGKAYAFACNKSALVNLRGDQERRRQVLAADRSHVGSPRLRREHLLMIKATIPNADALWNCVSPAA
jgi:hypothetical protein